MKTYQIFEQKKSGQWIWRRNVRAGSRADVMLLIQSKPKQWLKLATGNLKVRLKDDVTDGYGQSVMRTVSYAGPVLNPLNLEVTS